MSYNTTVWRPQGGASIQTSVDVGAASSDSTVSVVEYGIGQGVHKTVLTLATHPLLCEDQSNTVYIGDLLYTFPAGATHVLGCSTDLDILSDLGASATISCSLGTGAPSDATLTAADVAFVDKTDISLSSSAGVFNESTATNGTPAAYWGDGSSTAIKFYLNLIDADDTGGASNYTYFTGTITIVWVNLGDS